MFVYTYIGVARGRKSVKIVSSINYCTAKCLMTFGRRLRCGPRDMFFFLFRQKGAAPNKKMERRRLNFFYYYIVLENKILKHSSSLSLSVSHTQTYTILLFTQYFVRIYHLCVYIYTRL